MKTNMDMHHTHGEAMDGVSDPFSRDTTGLPDALAPQTVMLQPDEVLELRAEQVRKRVGEATVKMMAPVPIGGSFTYRVRFPDPGIYWYHPHMREDYTQELGLYAPIIVVPTDAMYWSPVNREVTLTLDDLLLEDGKIAPFSRTLSDHTAMGRFGNVMLVNGETSPQLSANQGEVVRLYLVNTGNVRVFNVRLPGV